MEYEIVKKTEYQPVRIEIESIIKKVQKILRKNPNMMTFQFKLVGSGKRHLITRIKGGNKGFDFDYNLILNCEKGYYWKADYAKKEIMKAFKEAIKGTNYDNPEDSTTSITLKVKDIKNSKIIHSCDFALIYYPSNTSEEYYKYIKNNKTEKKYTWEIRKCSKKIEYKFNWLRENIKDFRKILEKHYIHLKEINKDVDKHSFQLYYEAINNMYNTAKHNGYTKK